LTVMEARPRKFEVSEGGDDVKSTKGSIITIRWKILIPSSPESSSVRIIRITPAVSRNGGEYKKWEKILNFDLKLNIFSHF
jgi:hypothetical protein